MNRCATIAITVFTAKALSVLLLILIPCAHAEGLGFTLPGLNDRPVQLADFRGQWVVVNFWASWCTPCLLEMPELESFHQGQHGHAIVIGVNFENLAPSEVQFFAQRLGLTFPIALSGAKRIPGFPLKGLPTTFLVSPTGQLVETHLGMVNAALLTERLAELERASASIKPPMPDSPRP